MRKRFDDTFAVLMLLSALAVVLAGAYCLSHSIARTRAEGLPAPTAPTALEPPRTSLEPVLAIGPEREPAQPPLGFDAAIPLPLSLQGVLRESCAQAGVPVALALGLIEVESGFDPLADNGRCYGLCQLNRDYFPDKLSPADNLREGIVRLGCLLGQYEDPAAALTAYNAGYDTGGRAYAEAVLEAADRWGGTVSAANSAGH